MSVKLVLDWASLLSELVQLFRIAAFVVHWWRSLYYPVFLYLHLNMPHWAMDVLGAGFALGNIAAALMAIKSRSVNPDDKVGRFSAIFLTLLHYIHGFHLVVRDIARGNPKKALERYLHQPVPYILSSLINLSIAAVALSALSLNMTFFKWSVLSFFYSLILIVVFVAWVAASFDFKFFGKYYRNVHPIRWIVGALATTYLLSFTYAFVQGRGLISWLEKNGFV